MLFYAFLFLFYLSSSGVDCFDFESLNGDDFEVIDPYVGEARFFGNVSNIFNSSSLISIVAIFIGGIILFGENLFCRRTKLQYSSTFTVNLHLRNVLEYV